MYFTLLVHFDPTPTFHLHEYVLSTVLNIMHCTVIRHLKPLPPSLVGRSSRLNRELETWGAHAG